MIATEEEKQSVGWTDMRIFMDWLHRAPFPVQWIAYRYPPGVYRLKLRNGELVRVCIAEYSIDESGTVELKVILPRELNPEDPLLIPVRLTGVDPKELTPIKWPPDARVH